MLLFVLCLLPNVACVSGLSCLDCPVLIVLSGVFCLSCPVLIVLSGLSCLDCHHQFLLTYISQSEISCFNGWLHLECSFSLYLYLIKRSAIKISNITQPHKTNIICYIKFTDIINCLNKYTDKAYTKV